MYKKHFGLTEKPFSLLPDPSFLYFSAKHKMAFNVLEYGLLEQTGITVISGDVGSGKTTLLRHLVNRLSSEELTVGMVNNTSRLMGNLQQLVALAFGIDHAGHDNVTLYRMLQDFFIAEYAAGMRVVLIVDEAQNLNTDELEELRMLTNVNAGTDQLLQVILVGQPELRDTLSQQSMTQLAQRVSAEYHLKELDFEETVNFIHFRTRTAGAERHLFDLSAAMVIYYLSGGVPRLINTLCDHALVCAYALDAKQVNLEIALDSAKEKRIGGIQRFGVRTPDAEKIREAVLGESGVDIEELISGN